MAEIRPECCKACDGIPMKALQGVKKTICIMPSGQRRMMEHISGYSGHVPNAQFIVGSTFPETTKEGLKMFNKNNAKNRGPVCRIVHTKCAEKEKDFDRKLAIMGLHKSGQHIPEADEESRRGQRTGTQPGCVFFDKVPKEKKMRSENVGCSCFHDDPPKRLMHSTKPTCCCMDDLLPAKCAKF